MLPIAGTMRQIDHLSAELRKDLDEFGEIGSVFQFRKGVRHLQHFARDQ